MFNHPSPVARQLWYYLRALGRVKHPPSFRLGHDGEDGFLLHFMLRGQLWHRVQERRFVLGRGEAFLMDLGRPVEYGTHGVQPAEFYWALFNGRDVPRVFVEVQADRNPHFTGIDARRMACLFRELMRLNARQPPGYDVKASATIVALLGELFATRTDGVGPSATSDSPRPFSAAVRKGIDCVARFYDRPLPIKHIASAAGQNLHSFSRLFRREVGVSPVAYLNQYRIDQAKHLLESSDKSIAEVARSVGLPDQNYFARLFTHINGVSPSRYRAGRQKPRA